MKRLLLCGALLFPMTAQGTFKGLDDLRVTQAREAAESSRQEKWMWLIGLIAAAGIGYVIWKEYDKKQGK